MNQNEESKTEIVVSRNDWESFISSLERLMTLHQRTLQSIKELRIRNNALRAELRSALTLPIIKHTTEKGGPPGLAAFQRCRYCDREIQTSARFCDRCGRNVVVLMCGCGRELGRFDKFCDSCGRPAQMR